MEGNEVGELEKEEAGSPETDRYIAMLCDYCFYGDEWEWE